MTYLTDKVDNITHIKESESKIQSYSKKYLKSAVLNTFLREDSVRFSRVNAKSLSYDVMTKSLGTPRWFVEKILDNFFKNLVFLRKFLNECAFKWPRDYKRLFRKSRVYLHKIHRLAPIFDYSRARANLKILQSMLARNSFWPHLSTQLAIVVYVTDLLDENYSRDNKIIQQNVRLICNCSAYAFHRTRNLLGINLMHEKLLKGEL